MGVHRSVAYAPVHAASARRAAGVAIEQLRAGHGTEVFGDVGHGIAQPHMITRMGADHFLLQSLRSEGRREGKGCRL